MANGADKTKDLTDHDLLIGLNARVEALHECLKRHLAHHWAVTLLAGIAVLSAILSWFTNLAG